MKIRVDGKEITLKEVAKDEWFWSGTPKNRDSITRGIFKDPRLAIRDARRELGIKRGALVERISA